MPLRWSFVRFGFTDYIDFAPAALGFHSVVPLFILFRVFAQGRCRREFHFRFRTAHCLMHRLRAKVNAAGPFHAAKVGIDGDSIENPRVQQFQKHAAAPFRFNGKNPSHTVVEGDFQPAVRQRFGGSNPNHVFILLQRRDSGMAKDIFYARPHRSPLPQERTLLRTIFKHLDAGRANTADGELEVGRKTIHLLLPSSLRFDATINLNRAVAQRRRVGEKAGMRADVNSIGAQRHLTRSIPQNQNTGVLCGFDQILKLPLRRDGLLQPGFPHPQPSTINTQPSDHCTPTR
jgi:hypothetical protein